MSSDLILQGASAAGGAVTNAALTPILGPLLAAGVAPTGGAVTSKVAEDAVSSIADLAQGDVGALGDLADLAINPADEEIHAASEVFEGVPVLGDVAKLADHVLDATGEIPILGPIISMFT